jgi:aromatic ring-opening dioxygenase catalytic subunit (LigB family)
MSKRLPAIYIPHGGGPWPFVELGPRPMWAPLEGYLRSMIDGLPERPKALLVISAHWEEKAVTLMNGARPPMLYDYYGFPESAYELSWPAPGAPALATKARALLDAAGFETAFDPARGFDHGTFVPMMLAVPNADIPTLQVSLLQGLDPARHLALGKALAPLRDEGVLLIGSGSSYHNMRGFGSQRAIEPSRRFDAWLAETAVASPAERAQRLIRWADAPAARECHPREEHLLPLHVVSGAAQDEVGVVPFHFDMMGARASAVQFG